MLIEVVVHVLARDDGTPAYTDVYRCNRFPQRMSNGDLHVVDFDGIIVGEYESNEWDHIEIKKVSP